MVPLGAGSGIPDRFAKGGKDVSSPHSWTRRPGRCIGRRVALRGRVRRRPFRAGFSQLRVRAHGRAGDGVLPHRRQGNPPARAGDAARRADHPGPDAALPGRPVQGPAQRRVTSSSTRPATSPTSGWATSCAGSSASRLCTVPATEIAIKHVGRPVPNVPLLAGFAAISGEIKLESVILAVREKFPGKIAEANVAAATEAYALRETGAGGPPCLSKSKVRTPSPKRSRCRVRRSSAPIRSPRRRTSSRAWARWSRTARSRIASSSTSRANSPRCRWRSAPRPPARAPTRRRRARACCSWPRRSTTPPASGCRS